MHIGKSRITYRLLTMALDNEIRDNFSFCLTIVSIMNVKFIRKKKLLPFILIEWWNQAPRWAPFGCQEPHMTETVLLSLNGERPRMLSMLQFEGQSHLTENSPVLNSKRAPVELHWYNWLNYNRIPFVEYLLYIKSLQNALRLRLK